MRFLLFLLLAVCLLPACGPDRAVEGQTNDLLLVGRWELVSARRDNVKTGLLDELYFDFGAEDAFKTNLLTGEEQIGTYALNGDVINTEGIEVELTYEIQEITGTTLNLRSRYEGFIFDFELKRTLTEEEEL